MYRRKPAVAGAFYTGNENLLRKEITSYLSKAEKKNISGEIIALIAPHAGYVYSGPIAAYSYTCLEDSGIDVAVVLAPSHRARFQGASVIPEGVYETPLGGVEIDAAIGKKLESRPGFAFIREAHEAEHSLEVQVPFLQMVLGSFNIVPVIVGTIDLDQCEKIASEIAAVLEAEKRKYVIIISTDLSHFHSYETASDLDGNFAEGLKSFNVNQLKSILDSGKAEACGEGPVLTGMMIAAKLGGKNVEILKYANSGDTAGGRSQVVGYLSAAIIK